MRTVFALLTGLTILGLAATAHAFAPDGAALVKKVKKSVIRIQGIPISSPMPNAGYGGGSGVVFQIDYDRGIAYALTNHHVSGDAFVNSVRFWDGAEYRAELVATEPGIDTALLRIVGIPDERGLPHEEKTITASPLGDSEKVMIGEFAMVYGSPGAAEGFNADRGDPQQGFMLQQTSTMRVVTGKDNDPRRYPRLWGGWKNGLGRQVMVNTPWSFVIQSAVNGGNSGGPLFNTSGEVIGLNHATFRTGDGQISQNEHYTIPINPVKNFAFQILNTGKYEIPWFGFDMLVPQQFDSSGQIGEFMDKHLEDKVLRVWGVRKGSSAELAGLQHDDVIVEFDGRTFPTIGDLRRYIFDLPIGKQVPLTVKRGTRKVNMVMEVTPKRSFDSDLSF